MFFKHFACKSQLPGFYISGTLVKNRLNQLDNRKINAEKETVIAAEILTKKNSSTNILNFNLPDIAHQECAFSNIWCSEQVMKRIELTVFFHDSILHIQLQVFW